MPNSKGIVRIKNTTFMTPPASRNGQMKVMIKLTKKAKVSIQDRFIMLLKNHWLKRE